MSWRRKVVLLLDANEQARGVREYMLWTHGYRVISVATAAAAFEALGAERVDLVLAAYVPPVHLAEALVHGAWEIDNEAKFLFISTCATGEYVSIDGAAGFLATAKCTPAEILHRVRIMACRKRGPRKQPEACDTAAGVGQVRA